MLEIEKNFFISDDDVKVFYSKYYKKNKLPKMIVQISHGMKEYIDKYDRLARFLAKKDIFVYGNDHRGHGLTGMINESFGVFSETNGLEKAIRDLKRMRDLIGKDYPNTKVVMISHSMGSILARCYIQYFSNDFDGVLLMGSIDTAGAFENILSLFASNINFMFGPTKSSTTLNDICELTFSKPFDENNKYSWISRDQKTIKQIYQDNPLCEYEYTNSFFEDLSRAVLHCSNQNFNKRIRKDLPILFLSGNKDIVGNFGKGIKNSVLLYKECGLKNVKYKLYKNARHELLNEFNKKEVYDDIYSFLKRI